MNPLTPSDLSPDEARSWHTALITALPLPFRHIASRSAARPTTPTTLNMNLPVLVAVPSGWVPEIAFRRAEEIFSE